MIHDVTCSFRLVSSTTQNLISGGLPVLEKFLQTAEECCNRNICRTFCKLGSLIKSNFDRWFLYKCQISDSLFDVWFPTFQFYLFNMWGHNFQTVLQTSEEFWNKNIPVVFTTSTSNGGLQRGLDFFDLWFCYSLLDFSVKSFCEKVWLSWVPCVKFGLFLLSRLKFWLIRNDTFYGIWLPWPIFWQNFLDLPPFRTPW